FYTTVFKKTIKLRFLWHYSNTEVIIILHQVPYAIAKSGEAFSIGFSNASKSIGKVKFSLYISIGVISTSNTLILGDSISNS
ncbi:hypothetical protein, partial [Pseudoalteromonas sp. 31A1]|uniref:hypothetical protein n=1 Tax=Pseudoalteromonas sp. 31A1 TaxID=2686351 RepID=UPI0013FD5DD8